MNDFLKVLLGLVLLCAIPLGCLALAGLTNIFPSLGRLLDRIIPLPDHDKDPQ